MFKSKTSWREKLEKVSDHKIVNIPPRMQKRFGKGKMLIPKPFDIDALIKKVRKGKLVTQSQLREKLANDFKVDSTCPITTGIFLRIISEASQEDSGNGKRILTPYWRVVGNDGSLNDKFPGGAEAQADKLKSERQTIVKSKNGKLLLVSEFEKKLTKL